MDIQHLSQRLEAQLGDRLPPGWREAYRAVPRHLFVPDQAVRGDGEHETGMIDRRGDPQAWLETAYSEDVIITQHDEHGKPSSSCSMPEMVFAMLDLLEVESGHTVLEIGTGTGWNAALLAHRAGERRVYTVEVDEEVAGTARHNLDRAGIHPTVIVGDGADGFLLAAPFDRVIATCTVRQVPHPWIGQTRPGGLIVAPVGTPLDSGGIVRLRVGDDGTASGRFALGSSFMMLRAQQFTAPDEPDDFDQHAEVSKPTVDIAEALAPAPAFVAGHVVPNCKIAYDYTEDGTIETVWLLAEDSWASVHLSTTVRQLGTRRLWDEVEAAYSWWVLAGCPDLTRFGLTVTADRQWVWLETPDQPVPSAPKAHGEQHHEQQGRQR